MNWKYLKVGFVVFLCFFVLFVCLVFYTPLELKNKGGGGRRKEGSEAHPKASTKTHKALPFRNIQLLKCYLKCLNVQKNFYLTEKVVSSTYSIIKIGQYNYRKQYNKILIFGHYQVISLAKNLLFISPSLAVYHN